MLLALLAVARAEPTPGYVDLHIHLAAHLAGPSILVRLGCLGHGLAPRRSGLTERGRASIGALIDAGPVLDAAHASPASFTDLLGILAERGVAPVYPHAPASEAARRPALPGDGRRPPPAWGPPRRGRRGRAGREGVRPPR